MECNRKRQVNQFNILFFSTSSLSEPLISDKMVFISLSSEQTALTAWTMCRWVCITSSVSTRLDGPVLGGGVEDEDVLTSGDGSQDAVGGVLDGSGRGAQDGRF